MIATETDQGLLGMHFAYFDGAHLIDAAVGRDLDNHVADWGLALIIVGGTVIVMLVAYAAVKRFLGAWRSESSSQTVAGITAMVMTMFAVLVAFVIVNLYSSYDSAANNVALEATSLSDLVRDAGDFPPAARTRIERAVAQYVAQYVAQVPTDDGAEAFVDAEDIAAVAAAALASPDAHAGAEYAPTGAEALTISAAADMIADVTGQPTKHHNIDRDVWIDGTVAAGVPAAYGEVLRTLTETVASGHGSRPNNDVENVTGRPPISFADFARRTAQAWA